MNKRKFLKSIAATAAMITASLAYAETYKFHQRVSGLKSSVEAFSKHTFTTCGKYGFNGPSLEDCISSYNTQWSKDIDSFSILHDGTNNQGIQVWTVPYSGDYRITAAGGTSLDSSGIVHEFTGRGVIISGTFTLTKGDKIYILAGQIINSSAVHGGGGTFVVSEDLTPLIIAGGGGGRTGWPDQPFNCGNLGNASTTISGNNGCIRSSQGGTNGNGGKSAIGTGGAGFLTNSATEDSNRNRARSFMHVYNNNWVNRLTGTFGGGGVYINNRGDISSGGGGGYSGGGSGERSGGGGGSINNGNDQVYVGLNETGSGYVVVERIDDD